jgi:hypothetical protein
LVSENHDAWNCPGNCTDYNEKQIMNKIQVKNKKSMGVGESKLRSNGISRFSRWLTNDTHPFLASLGKWLGAAEEHLSFKPRRPSIDEWIMKMMYIDNGGLAIRKNDMPFAGN